MGRGGARFGAGRPGWRLKAEHCCRIDVRVWHRLHGFRDGYSGSWVWNVGGEPAGSISYSVSEHAVTLRYSTNGTSIAEPVRLERTACNYGGHRPWFRCPGCSDRVALLYLRSGRFACRTRARIVDAIIRCEEHRDDALAAFFARHGFAF
jgi:hypothetical protein